MVYFAPDDGGARGCNVFGDSFELCFAGEPLNKGFDYHNVDPSSVLFAGKQVLRVINGGRLARHCVSVLKQLNQLTGLSPEKAC